MSDTQITGDIQIDNTDDLDAFSADFFGQKPAESTETKVEAEQEQKVEAGVAAEEVDPNAELEAEFVETPAKKPTVQDRINELVKQREDIKRDAAAEVDKLRKEFADKLAALEPQKPVVPVPGEPTAADLNPDGTEKYPLGEFDPQFIRDLTRHTLAEETKKAYAKQESDYQARQQQESQQALQAEWNGKVEAAKAEYPDLIEKGQALLNGFNTLPPEYATYLGNVLMSMEKGPDVLYYLSSNPQEAVTIVNSGAQKATLALGRIEAKFLQADAEKAAAKPKITKAPAPPTERARGTNGAFISVAPDTDDLDAFSAEFFRKK
jgi:hypothetical protein